jgi:hypothetical protein
VRRYFERCGAVTVKPGRDGPSESTNMSSDVEMPPEPSSAPKLSPAFRVELRRRYDEAAPLEKIVIHARTIASARHAVKLSHPDAVILSIGRVE